MATDQTEQQQQARESANKLTVARRLLRHRSSAPSFRRIAPRLILWTAGWIAIAGLATLPFYWFAPPISTPYLFALIGMGLGATAHDVRWVSQLVRYWPALEQFVDWKRVQEAEPAAGELAVDQKILVNRPESSGAVRARVARGLCKYRSKRPKFGVLALGIFLKNSLWIVGAWCVMFFYAPWLVSSGWMTPMFFLCGSGVGVMARDLGLACDGEQYWPALEAFVDWPRVEEAAGSC